VCIERAGKPEQAAHDAARIIASCLRDGIRKRDSASLALSGGNPARLLPPALARETVDWAAVHVFQVDERAALRGSPDRNLTTIEDMLVFRAGLPLRHLHAMCVDHANLQRRLRNSYAWPSGT